MPRPLSPEARAERAAYVRDARDRGVAWKDIAAHLGVNLTTLVNWWHTGGRGFEPPSGKPAQTTAERAYAKPGVTKRDCLSCGQPFPSHGAGNRRCKQCLANAASMSPYAPDPGGNRGRQTLARRDG